MEARTAAKLQIRDLLITAPAPVRKYVEAVHGGGRRINRAGALRPDLERLNDPHQAAKFALRQLSRHVKSLDEQIDKLDVHLTQLVAACAPTLTACRGIGTQHAAQLLIKAGPNIEQLENGGAFARRCSVAPVPISSGKTNRMRLHRGGDRKAKKTLHHIAVARIHIDPLDQVHMERRRAEGLSKRDVVRYLKRFIAREVFNALKQDLL